MGDDEDVDAVSWECLLVSTFNYYYYYYYLQLELISPLSYLPILCAPHYGDYTRVSVPILRNLMS